MSALGSLSPDDQKKLDSFIEACKKNFQEIVADDLGITVRPLMGAAKTAFKNDLAAKQEEMDTMVDILNATGNAG
jgi:hypothetical protein